MNNNPYFTNYGQAQPNANGNPNGNPDTNPNPNEPISPYHQYSPGTAPPSFMPQQAQRHPSQSIPNCGPQYPTPQYAHAPAQHLPMPPQMDLAPMGSRTHAPQYTIQQPTAPGISPNGTMPFHLQRPDLSAPRRPTVSGNLTGYGDPRIPRTQTNLGSGAVASMLRSDSNQNSSSSCAKGKNKSEKKKEEPPLHTTIPPELVNLCVTNGDRVCLNEKASDEDHYLFDIHCQQQGTRGKGMWDNITNQYYKATSVPQTSTPCLQMKHIRSVRKNFMLPREGFERLCAIYEEDERNRYNRILTAFKEVYDIKYELKAPELECYFVRLGLESPTLDEATKTRRRRRSNAKREQRNSTAHGNAARNDRNHTPPGTIWNNSYGQISIDGSHQYPLPGPASHHQHPGHMHPSQNFDFSTGMGPGLNIDQEETLMVDIAMKYGESPMTDPSPNGSTPGSGDPNDVGNPMLSDISGHSRMLPSPNGSLPNGSAYNPLDRNLSNANTKHESWK